MAHGHGVCGSGPNAKEVTEFSGLWQEGFEVNGVCRWMSGTTYGGQWLQGKQHGLGVETKGHWTYKGEWTHGCKGRYGSCRSMQSNLRYEGSWTSGVKDGYGVETYPDEGTYHGQWMRGMRHGYGVRQSASYITTLRSPLKSFPNTSPSSEISDNCLVSFDRDSRMEEIRGGFVLQARTTPVDDSPSKTKKPGLLDRIGRQSLRKSLANELKIIRQKSAGDLLNQGRPQSAGASSRASSTGGSVRSTASAFSQISSVFSGSSARRSSEELDEELGSFCSDVDLANDRVTEKYAGEWKNDKRSGFGICERSDGVKYEGEWLNNRKHGYGVTTLSDGARLEGKYKNNILVSAWKSSKLFALRSNKIRDKVEISVSSAQKAANIALQKMETANVRMTSARVRADQADEAARKAASDAEIASKVARQYSAESQGVPVIANRQLNSDSVSNQFVSPVDKSSDRSKGLTQNVNPAQHQLQPNEQLPKTQKKFTFFKRKGDSSRRSKSETRNSQTPGFSLFGSNPLKSNTVNKTKTNEFPTLSTFNQGYESISNSTLSNPTLRSNALSSIERDYNNVYQPSTHGYSATVDSKAEISLNVPNWSDSLDTNSNFYSAQRNTASLSPSPKTTEDHNYPLSRDSIYNIASRQRGRELDGAAEASIHPQVNGGGYPLMKEKQLPLRDNNSLNVSYNKQNQETINNEDMARHGSYTVESVEASTVMSAWSINDPHHRKQLGSEGNNQISAWNQNHMVSQKHPSTSIHPYDNAPTMDNTRFERDNLEASRDRRKSLPSIVKEPPPNSPLALSFASSSTTRSIQATSSTPSKTILGQTSLNIFSPRPNPVHPADNVPTDTYVIENGVRKRVKPAAVAKVTTALPKVPHYELEASKAPYKRGDLGSLPDVSVISDSEVLPREIVYQLSQRRREELMKEREEMERRYGGNIVLRIEDILEWFWKKKLLVLILFLNVALLYVFLSLLKDK